MHAIGHWKRLHFSSETRNDQYIAPSHRRRKNTRAASHPHQRSCNAEKRDASICERSSVLKESDLNQKLPDYLEELVAVDEQEEKKAEQMMVRAGSVLVN